jgi:hypothetical protein
MIEPLFGTASPMWAGAAPGAFGWAVPLGNRPILSPAMGFGPPQVSPSTLGAAGLPAGRSQTIPSPAVLSPEAYDFGRSAAGGALPPALPPEIAYGYSVPALLATIAMRRGQPLGPTNDQEIEDFLYDALELLAGTSEVEVRCDGGRATLTGTVQHKRLKHDVGEIAWGIPSLNDVQNNVTIATRRRARPANREPEPQQSQPGRK